MSHNGDPCYFPSLSLDQVLDYKVCMGLLSFFVIWWSDHVRVSCEAMTPALCPGICLQNALQLVHTLRPTLPTTCRPVFIVVFRAIRFTVEEFILKYDDCSANILNTGWHSKLCRCCSVLSYQKVEAWKGFGDIQNWDVLRLADLCCLRRHPISQMLLGRDLHTYSLLFSRTWIAVVHGDHILADVGPGQVGSLSQVSTGCFFVVAANQQ